MNAGNCPITSCRTLCLECIVNLIITRTVQYLSRVVASAAVGHPRFVFIRLSELTACCCLLSVKSHRQWCAHPAIAHTIMSYRYLYFIQILRVPYLLGHSTISVWRPISATMSSLNFSQQPSNRVISYDSASLRLQGVIY